MKRNRNVLREFRQILKCHICVRPCKVPWRGMMVSVVCCLYDLLCAGSDIRKEGLVTSVGPSWIGLLFAWRRRQNGISGTLTTLKMGRYVMFKYELIENSSCCGVRNLILDPCRCGTYIETVFLKMRTVSEILGPYSVATRGLSSEVTYSHLAFSETLYVKQLWIFLGTYI
jgi:hypothetical protein